MMSEAIFVEGLTKAYNGRTVIDHLNLSVKSGSVFGLLGANGAGKSTTIECILGTKQADAGNVRLLGEDPGKHRRSLFERIGVQFQEGDYHKEIRVSELCEETSCLYRKPADWRVLCDQFGIGGKADAAVRSLSGGVSEVFAMTKKSFPERLITSEPHKGEIIHVDVDTYLAGSMRFRSGAIGTLFTTFDVYYPGQARVEVYGSKGTMFVPDPNCFGGEVRIFTPEKGMETIPLIEGYPENSRGIGIRDMARHILTGSEFRCSYKQTFHALEVMEGFSVSGREKREVSILSEYERSGRL